MTVVSDLIDGIVEKEKGYVNNPNDSGGETNWGITKAEARSNGYYGPMTSMPLTVARDIYLNKYWIATGLARIADISVPVAERLLDIAVNQGIYRAGEFCQRLLNALNRNERDYTDLKVDGKMGPATRLALTKFLSVPGGNRSIANSTEVFLKGLRSMQGYFYIDLAERRPKDEEFLYGWLYNRA